MSKKHAVGIVFPILLFGILGDLKYGTMKKMILLMTVFGTIGFEAMAQTNRTYKTDMSTERIKAEERTGGGIQRPGTVRLNHGTNNMELQGQQPLRVMDVHQWQGFRADGREYRLPTPEEFMEQTKGWDTSLTNGHCLGCGSGATTDYLQYRDRNRSRQR